MRKRFFATLTSILLMVAMDPIPASAHVVERDTRLSIHKSPSQTVDEGDKVLIMGRLRPRLCQEREVIKLMKKRPGRDKVLDRDRTDGDGEYVFRLRPNNDLKVYTKFRGSVSGGDYGYGTYYGHSHTCNRSRSRTIEINVDG